MDNEALEHRVADLERRLKELEAVMYPPVMYRSLTWPPLPVVPVQRYALTYAVPDGPPSY